MEIVSKIISAYSYNLKCYKCSRGLLRNIILYLTVAYFPLTVFLAIVVIFHISFSTPLLHGIIYLCQCFTMPALMQVFIHETRCTTGQSIYLKIEASLYEIIMELGFLPNSHSSNLPATEQNAGDRSGLSGSSLSSLSPGVCLCPSQGS